MCAQLPTIRVANRGPKVTGCPPCGDHRLGGVLTVAEIDDNYGVVASFRQAVGVARRVRGLDRAYVSPYR